MLRLAPLTLGGHAWTHLAKAPSPGSRAPRRAGKFITPVLGRSGTRRAPRAAAGAPERPG